MKLVGHLDHQAVAALVAESLRRKFQHASMTVVDVTIPTFYQDATFTLDDEPGADAVLTQAELEVEL
jgi:hypothetical protein